MAKYEACGTIRCEVRLPERTSVQTIYFVPSQDYLVKDGDCEYAVFISGDRYSALIRQLSEKQKEVCIDVDDADIGTIATFAAVNRTLVRLEVERKNPIDKFKLISIVIPAK